MFPMLDLRRAELYVEVVALGFFGLQILKSLALARQLLSDHVLGFGLRICVLELGDGVHVVVNAVRLLPQIFRPQGDQNDFLIAVESQVRLNFDFCCLRWRLLRLPSRSL